MIPCYITSTFLVLGVDLILPYADILTKKLTHNLTWRSPADVIVDSVVIGLMLLVMGRSSCIPHAAEAVMWGGGAWRTWSEKYENVVCMQQQLSSLHTSL
uniref:Hypothetical secreted peptide n=1 Tax=Triatoma matogrossensis TaxID=162370 RepID=E2J7C2_9HEMI